MKEDYLWDKTGNDPEIEKLENVLKAFRQKDETLLAIPAKIIPVKSESPRRIFPFAFAFAASIAFVLILVGVWSQFGTGNSQIVNDLAQDTQEKDVLIPVEKSFEKIPQTSFDNDKDSSIKVSDVPKENRKRKVSKVKGFQATKIRHLKRINRKPQVKQINSPQTETVKLTKEEQYAYDQLMLALSITSEKLNLVKDKVNGEVKQEFPLKKRDNIRSN